MAGPARPPDCFPPHLADAGSDGAIGAPVHRRAFLASCAVLALCASGCQVAPRTRLGRILLVDPHPDDYLPILRAVVSAVLPFEHPRFPAATPDAIVERLLGLFPLEDREQYAALQRSLLVFDEVDLFAESMAPIRAEDARLLRLEGIGDEAGRRALLDDRAAADRAAYERFATTPPRRFTQLSVERRRAYLSLWAHSGFTTKRRFYRSTRALVMISAYSSRDFWNVIGYDGPLIDRPS